MDEADLVRALRVKWLGGHRLHVEFENGDGGEVDLAKHVRFEGLFKPLADPAFVSKVRVDDETGLLVWPGDVDFDPVLLHHYVTGKRMPKWAGPIVDSKD